jgi:hypothetical protein
MAVSLLTMSLMFYCISVPGISAEKTEKAHQPDPGADWRTSDQVAVNCLYMFLRSRDVAIDYAALQAAMPRSAHGTAFVELRNASAHYGVGGHIRKCMPDDLTQKLLPLIVFMDRSKNDGDYALLIWKTQQAAALITGYGTYKELSIDDFRRAWSGYVLLPNSPGFSGVGLASLTGLVAYACLRMLPQFLLLLTKKFRRAHMSPIHIKHVVLIALAISPTYSLAAQTGLPDKVEQALRENARAIDPLTVSWKLQRTSSWSNEALAPLVGDPIMNGSFIPEETTYRCQGGKVYSFLHHLGGVRSVEDSKTNPSQKYKVDLQIRLADEESCDGVSAYTGNGIEVAKSQNITPNVMIRRLHNLVKKKGDISLADPGYVMESGFRTPQAPQDFLEEGIHPESHVLWLLKHGGILKSAKEEAVDGMPCFVVEISGSERLAQNIRHKKDRMDRKDCLYIFHLDPNRRYAVLRREERSPAGKLGVLAECSDFVQLPKGGIWIPKRCVVTLYTDWLLKYTHRITDKPLFVLTYNVTAFDQHPIPEETFVLEYNNTPGAYISTDALPGLEGKIHYYVPTNPQDLEATIQKAIHGKRERSTLHWIIVVNLLIVAICSLIFWARRRLKRLRT